VTPGPAQPKSAGPLAQHPLPAMYPAPPEAIQQPHLDGQPIRPDGVVVQGGGHRSLHRAAQASGVAPPASGIRQLAHP
jgi:hypothetical protein